MLHQTVAITAAQGDPKTRIEDDEETNTRILSEDMLFQRWMEQPMETLSNNEKLQRHVYYVINAPTEYMALEPSHSEVMASRAYQICMFLLILGSVIQLFIESLPDFYQVQSTPLDILEILCIAFFSNDMLMKFYVSINKLRFFTKFPTLIDLMSILPYYIEKMTENGSGGVLVVFRVVRLARVFRVFKLSKYSKDIDLVFITVNKSRNAISLLVFLVLIALTIFSSLMFFFEQAGCTYNEKKKLWIREDGTVSPFQSIPDSMWWCIVTLTTVGYGDDVPVTGAGKVVASVAMLTGVLVLAFPTMILGKTFNDVTDAANRQQEYAQKMLSHGRPKMRTQHRQSVVLGMIMDKMKKLLETIRSSHSEAIASRYKVAPTPPPETSSTPPPPNQESYPQAATTANTTSPPPDFTSFANSEIENFCVFNYRNRQRVISMVPGMYTPLFTYQPILSFDGQGASGDFVHHVVPESCFVTVYLQLDHPDAHVAACEAVLSIIPTVTPDAVSVSLPTLLTIESSNISIIAPYATITSDVKIYNPSAVVPIHVRSDNTARMDNLIKVLPHLILNCRLHFQSPTIFQSHVTIFTDQIKETAMYYLLKKAARKDGFIYVSELDMKRYIRSAVNQIESIAAAFARDGVNLTVENVDSIVEQIWVFVRTLCDVVPLSCVPEGNLMLMSTHWGPRTPCVRVDSTFFEYPVDIFCTVMVEACERDCGVQLMAHGLS